MIYVSGTCPHCHGAKATVVLVRFARPTRCEEMQLPCSTCDATGSLTEERAARLNAGEEMRRDRISRGLTLRDEAKRLGIDHVELSHREHGR